jgi:hypothetical protein
MCCVQQTHTHAAWQQTAGTCLLQPGVKPLPHMSHAAHELMRSLQQAQWRWLMCRSGIQQALV